MSGGYYHGPRLQHQSEESRAYVEPMNTEAECLSQAFDLQFDTLQPPINTGITRGIKTAGPLTSQLLSPASTANPDKSSVERYGESPQLVDSHSPVIATKACSCIACQDVNPLSSQIPAHRAYKIRHTAGYTFQCRIAGCEELFADINAMPWCNRNGYHNPNSWVENYQKSVYLGSHEISHFGSGGAYHCNEQYCQFITKRWRDLRRHYSSRHCKAPKKFPCHVLGCKYGGENGFAREDKLKSHVKNVHEGRLLPGQPGRIIKPRPIKPALSKKIEPEDQA